MKRAAGRLHIRRYTKDIPFHRRQPSDARAHDRHHHTTDIPPNNVRMNAQVSRWTHVHAHNHNIHTWERTPASINQSSINQIINQINHPSITQSIHQSITYRPGAIGRPWRGRPRCPRRGSSSRPPGLRRNTHSLLPPPPPPSLLDDWVVVDAGHGLDDTRPPPFFPPPPLLLLLLLPLGAKTIEDGTTNPPLLFAGAGLEVGGRAGSGPNSEARRPLRSKRKPPVDVF